MALVFSATFLTAWTFQRSRSWMLMVSLCYALSALGFTLQYPLLPIGIPMTRMLANTCFLAAMIAFTVALAQRCHRRPPVLIQSLIVGAALMTLTWFMFVQPNMLWRILVMNFALGTMLLVMAAEMRACAGRKKVDNLLLGLLVFNGLLFFGRSLVLSGLQGEFPPIEELHRSFYWRSFTLSNAVVSIITVIALLASAAAETIEALRAETNTDPLSGLLNRRGFELAAQALISDPRRAALPLTLITADLDRFKSINDTLGHDAGDRAIALFASALRDVIGDHHPAGRIGGEEFAMIVNGADLATARLIAEGVRIAFATLPSPDVLAGVSLSASFGVSEWRSNQSLSELLSRADDALYQAKEAGRDCVRSSPAAENTNREPGSEAA